MRSSPPAHGIEPLMPRELDVDSALAVLEDPLSRCCRQDMRTPEVFTALDFLRDAR
jgi:hypothetical protein